MVAKVHRSRVGLDERLALGDRLVAVFAKGSAVGAGRGPRVAIRVDLSKGVEVCSTDDKWSAHGCRSEEIQDAHSPSSKRYSRSCLCPYEMKRVGLSWMLYTASKSGSHSETSRMSSS